MYEKGTSHYPQLKSTYRYLYILTAVLLVAALVTILELTNTTYFFHKRPAAFPVTTTRGGATINTQKGEPTGSSSPPASSGEPGDNKSSSGSETTPVLIAPSGNFVSNHEPGKNGSPTIEASVCNTTAGAQCQIVFTHGATSKALPPQVTDRNGNTFWNSWSPVDIGLTAGTWQVKAVATLANQTKTSIDATSLIIMP